MQEEHMRLEGLDKGCTAVRSSNYLVRFEANTFICMK